MRHYLSILQPLALWLLTLVSVLFLGLAGLAKFTDAARWSALFLGWGYPGWLSPGIGAAEIAGALMLLFRRTAFAGGALLLTIMLAAWITLTVHESSLGRQAPAINAVLLSAVLMLRWWQRGAQREPG